MSPAFVAKGRENECNVSGVLPLPLRRAFTAATLYAVANQTQTRCQVWLCASCFRLVWRATCVEGRGRKRRTVQVFLGVFCLTHVCRR